MYLAQFQLRERPFSLTPDTQFFLNQDSHREALNTLLFALEHGEGFVKVVGDIGTGKTLLCRILLSRLETPRFVTAYIPNPWLSPAELKMFLASEIGADYQSSMPSYEVTESIYRRLVQLAAQQKQVVLVVDEAQSMPRETIEALRLLTNLETEKRKLLQVVILGQPELDELLKRKDLRQLKQRIVFSEYLKPLTAKSVAAYVRHRLLASGSQRPLFSRSALWLLACASGGIPRLVNIVAHKALLCAYGKGDLVIGGWHISKAVADTPECFWRGKALCLLWRINGRVLLQAVEVPR